MAGFSGARTMYGKGMGGIFSRIFKFVMPLARKGFEIAKPHLRSAAKDIAGDLIKAAVTRANQKQEGSGLVVLGRRSLKRPPGERTVIGGIKTAPLKRRKSDAPRNRRGKTQKRRKIKKKKKKKKTDIFS